MPLAARTGRIGVRCVVAAGWAVEDDAANQFAVAFYRALLGGQRFMDAVQAGRVNRDYSFKVASLMTDMVSALKEITLRDKAGAVVDGSAEKIVDVNDIWTFARDVTTRDPNWKLVATEEEE